MISEQSSQTYNSSIANRQRQRILGHPQVEARRTFTGNEEGIDAALPLPALERTAMAVDLFYNPVHRTCKTLYTIGVEALPRGAAIRPGFACSDPDL